jgi:hypothetical protein
MALIRKFEEIHKDTNRVHDPVECGYTAFEVNGMKYLQIDTYGSSFRQIKGKVSRSILPGVSWQSLSERFQPSHS